MVFEDVGQSGQSLFVAMPELKLEFLPVPFLPSLMLPGAADGPAGAWAMSLPLLLSVPSRSQRSFLVGISLKC